MAGAFQRLVDSQRLAITITIDGDKVLALDGDTVLTAILLHHGHLRLSDIGDEPRAGFCLMGACQDCWVSDGDGRRLRACTSYVRPGLSIITGRRDLPVASTDTPSAPGDDAVAADEPVAADQPTATDDVADETSAENVTAAAPSGADASSQHADPRDPDSQDTEEGRP